jgi:hypothetical protein
MSGKRAAAQMTPTKPANENPNEHHDDAEPKGAPPTSHIPERAG